MNYATGYLCSAVFGQNTQTHFIEEDLNSFTISTVEMIIPSILARATIVDTQASATIWVLMEDFSD